MSRLNRWRRRIRNLSFLLCALLLLIWTVSREWEVSWTSSDALTTWFAFEGRLSKIQWIPENNRSLKIPPLKPRFAPGWNYSPAAQNHKLMTQILENNSQAFIFDVFDVSAFLSSSACLITIATLFALALILTVLRRRPIPLGHCQSCNYNLTGNTSGICPECGKPITKDQRAGLVQPSPGGTPRQ